MCAQGIWFHVWIHCFFCWQWNRPVTARFETLRCIGAAFWECWRRTSNDLLAHKVFCCSDCLDSRFTWSWHHPVSTCLVPLWIFSVNQVVYFARQSRFVCFFWKLKGLGSLSIPLLHLTRPLRENNTHPNNCHGNPNLQLAINSFLRIAQTGPCQYLHKTKHMLHLNALLSHASINL